MGFANHMDKVAKDIDETENLINYEAKVKGSVDDMKSTKSKTSAPGHNKKVASFSKATTKKRQVIAAKQKAKGFYITPATGKWMVFHFLCKTQTRRKTAVNMEILTQKITITKPLDKMNWRPELELLKKHELGILAVRPAGATIGGKAMIWKDVKHCVPQTVELRSMLPEQSH